MEDDHDDDEGGAVESYEAANRDEGDPNAMDNMIYYFHTRDRLEMLNKRRLQYWLDVFT